MSGEEDAFAATREEDAVAAALPDDQAELGELMARKGKGKGKNKGMQIDYNDMGVHTDLDANQIFCEIDAALQHLTAVTAMASASSSRRARPPLRAPQVASRLPGRFRSSVSPRRERSRTREVCRNAKFFMSQARWGTSSFGGEWGSSLVFQQPSSRDRCYLRRRRRGRRCFAPVACEPAARCLPDFGNR